MEGVFASSLQTLSDALAPIASSCARFEWAISLQSGPFRELHFADEEDPRNLLHLEREDISSYGYWWFLPGLLPRYADELVHDEWSYYLGGDPSYITPKRVSEALGDELNPRKELFDFVAQGNCVYIMLVTDGWWEGYSGIPELRVQMESGWKGRIVSSDRWDGPCDKYHPFSNEPDE